MKQSRSKTGQFIGYSDSELYERYEADYESAEAKLAKRGDTMYVDKLNRAEFNAILIQSRNDGKKVGAKFVDDLVADSEYKISRKAAQASAKAYREYAKTHEEFAEEYGSTIRPYEFRQGLKDSNKSQAFFQIISDQYYQLKDSGLSGKAAGKEITRIFFYSTKRT